MINLLLIIEPLRIYTDDAQLFSQTIIWFNFRIFEKGDERDIYSENLVFINSASIDRTVNFTVKKI
ncbi:MULTISPECIES: hypothetical protein [unclassified Tolypothrix]|uniref:hypothetical protein n=1 Tax=unclassified Tolypothrix TaxID=2649714 RepID=UPI0005F7FE77|nr:MULTISPECIES: hypothetical protein [unclassified Tolypothrix]